MWLTVASRSAPGASAEATPAEPLASATAPAPATHQRLRNTLHLRVLVVPDPPAPISVTAGPIPGTRYAPSPRRRDATEAREPRQLSTGSGGRSRGAIAQAGGRV